MAKATATMRRVLNHEVAPGEWLHANQSLFNRVASFYFDVIRIVQFASAHSATILVFEHLGNLKPEKGKYSKRNV